MILDPLFQVNLVLFAAYPMPVSGRITPFFYNTGYRVYKVSPTLVLPAITRSKLSSIPAGVQSKSKPELLLKKGSSENVAIVECKTSSFSTTSSTAKQAVVNLALCNNLLRNCLAAPTNTNWSTSLMYFVSDNNEKLLHNCLSELSTQISHVGLTTNAFEVFGISCENDGIYFSLAFTAQQQNTSKVKILDLSVESDVRPLYLIPLDMGISKPDEYTKQQVNEKIKSSFVSILMRSIGNKAFEISGEEVLSRSLMLWDIWEDGESKKYLRNAAKNFIRDNLQALKNKYNIAYSENGTAFSICSVDDKQRQGVERYIMSREFKDADTSAFPGQLELEFG